MTRIFNLAFVLLGALAMSGCGTMNFVDSITTGSVPAGAQQAASSGHVYIFRGIGGKLATLDLDKLAEKINAQGVEAKVYDFMEWRGPAEEAIARYRREANPSPIVLLGHSAGADVALSFAEKLKAERIPVNLVVTLDPTRLPHDVPANVDRFLNIYASMNFFGGGNVKSGGEYRGHFASIDLKNYWEVPHVRMLRIGGLEDRLAQKIVRVATVPANLEGVTIPIRYVMPRGMNVELWDSGLPVQAEPNDSAATIATRYGVPPWLVAQLNNVDEGAPLALGRRVIIPRDLDAAPPPAIGGPLTSYVVPAR